MAAGCAGIPRVGRARRESPNGKLNIACVGVAGRGDGNLGPVSTENIVALCDVDFDYAANGFKRFPDAMKFADWRRMFDRMEKEIDAVVVSTPDHMHAPISLAAMQLGKHVYCEKPLTRTVGEARRVAEAAARYRVTTQMGNGGNASRSARRTVEVLRSGAIGPVREVYAWTDRPGTIWKQGLERPTDTPPVPRSLWWDLWLGVVPKRPYHTSYHPGQWRGWYDFGTGPIGDMGAHICNVAFWALDLRDPTAVECEVSGLHAESFPLWSRIVWEYPARGGRPALKFYWCDGGLKPSPDLVYGRGLPDNGMILVGDKGVMFIPNADGKDGVLLPEKDFEGFEGPPHTLPDSPGHHEEWIQAIKDGRHGDEWMSHFGRAGVMTECLVLGIVSVRLGKRIEWDSRTMTVTNLPNANKFADPPYREGWEV